MSHIPDYVISCYGNFGRCTRCWAHRPRGWRWCPKCFRWCGAGCEPERCWSGDALNKCRDCALSDDEKLCKICFDEFVDVILAPCGHSEFCGRCAAKIDCCPLCRRAIDVIPVIKAHKSAIGSHLQHLQLQHRCSTSRRF